MSLFHLCWHLGTCRYLHHPRHGQESALCSLKKGRWPFSSLRMLMSLHGVISQLLLVNSLQKPKAAAFPGKLFLWGLVACSSVLRKFWIKHSWPADVAGGLQPSWISEPFFTEQEESAGQATTPAVLLPSMACWRSWGQKAKQACEFTSFLKGRKGSLVISWVGELIPSLHLPRGLLRQTHSQLPHSGPRRCRVPGQDSHAEPSLSGCPMFNPSLREYLPSTSDTSLRASSLTGVKQI